MTNLRSSPAQGQLNKKHQAKRREHALQAAQLIAKRGLTGLTTRKIADYIGCSIGTLPHYFSDKDDIICSAFTLSSELVLQDIINTSSAEFHLQDFCQTLHKAMPLSSSREVNWRIRLELWSYALFNPNIKRSVNKVNQRVITALSNVIEKLQQQNEVRRELDATDTATTLFNLALGTGFHILQSPNKQKAALLKPLESYIQTIAVKSLLCDAKSNNE